MSDPVTQRVARRGEPRFRWLIVLLCVLCWAAAHRPARGDLPAASVHDVKAAFLYSFIKYVVWSDESAESVAGPLVIGVLGEDPIHDAVDAIATKPVGGRSLEIKHYDDIGDLEPCHLLFVGKSRRYRAADVMARISGAGTLTVGETRGFLNAGGTIGLRVIDNRVRFEVNLVSARAAGLSISSKLLRLAVRVDGAETVGAK